MTKYTIENSKNTDDLCFCLDKNLPQEEILKIVKNITNKNKVDFIKYDDKLDYSSFKNSDSLFSQEKNTLPGFNQDLSNVKLPKHKYEDLSSSYSQPEPDKIQKLDKEIQEKLVSVLERAEEELNIKPYSKVKVSKHPDTEYGVLDNNNFIDAYKNTKIFENFQCNKVCTGDDSKSGFFSEKESKYIFLIILLFIFIYLAFYRK